MLWITPDGREYRLKDMGISAQENYRIIQDESLQRRLGGLPPAKGLFADPNSEELIPLKGTYQIVIRGITFEEDSTIDKAELIVYGTVFGLFGTDHMRRDLRVPMLWGAPVALAFGLTATIGVNLLTVIIAATGAWYGGIIDGIIQRVTEVNLVLPFLSILIMVGTFYSKSLVVILGVTILLSIFGGGIKSYRAIFLQIRESTYIEAAKAYGASNSRIIFRYLIPRIIPLLIPSFVLGIPSFVFLEASLAVLGLGDPVIPTWGKVIDQAYKDGAIYNEQYYWILEPAAFLMLTGLGFAMLGFSLDRIFNPRLRGL
jgi:peptide/nickel transport system permease protein